MAIKSKKPRSKPKQVARAPRREPVAVPTPFLSRRWVQAVAVFVVGVFAMTFFVWLTNGLRSNDAEAEAAAEAATKRQAAMAYQDRGGRCLRHDRRDQRRHRAGRVPRDAGYPPTDEGRRDAKGRGDRLPGRGNRRQRRDRRDRDIRRQWSDRRPRVQRLPRRPCSPARHNSSAWRCWGSSAAPRVAPGRPRHRALGPTIC